MNRENPAVTTHASSPDERFASVPSASQEQ